jgi:uncharacterized protein (TIGR02246 family)
MIKAFFASMLMLAGWFCPGAGECAELAASERELLMQLAQRSDAYWDAGDAASLSALFADDADLRLGERVGGVGRAQILAYFTASFARREAGLHHVTEVTGLRELAPGVVLVDGHVRLERERADGGRDLLRRFLSHTVLVKQDGQWRFKGVRAHPQPAA